MLARRMPFAAVARIVGAILGTPAHRVTAVCTRYVELAVAQADLSTVTTLAIDETSRARGHDDTTLVADADARRVVFVTEGRDASTVEQLAEHLQAHGGAPEAIEAVSSDMSAAFIKGCASICRRPASRSTSSM